MSLPEELKPAIKTDIDSPDMESRYKPRALRADTFQDFQELLNQVIVEEKLTEVDRERVAGFLNRIRLQYGSVPL